MIVNVRIFVRLQHYWTVGNINSRLVSWCKQLYLMISVAVALEFSFVSKLNE